MCSFVWGISVIIINKYYVPRLIVVCYCTCSPSLYRIHIRSREEQNHWVLIVIVFIEYMRQPRTRGPKL